jgi:creatinine amidohydrolase/Fe(II)-dependent formamide hydrolase-like protein
LSRETERHKTKAERNSRYKQSTTTEKKGLVTNISFTTKARHKSKKRCDKSYWHISPPTTTHHAKHFEIFLMMMAQNPMPRQKKKKKTPPSKFFSKFSSSNYLFLV